MFVMDELNKDVNLPSTRVYKGTAALASSSDLVLFHLQISCNVNINTEL